MNPVTHPYTDMVDQMAQRPLDPIVEAVRNKLLRRSQIGMTKYGVALDRTDLDAVAWLIHLQEELLDAACYTERLVHELRKGS
jgi:hypothetical protein